MMAESVLSRGGVSFLDESRLKLLIEEVRAALEPEYMNNEQAARFLGIAPRTLIHWRWDGSPFIGMVLASYTPLLIFESI